MKDSKELESWKEETKGMFLITLELKRELKDPKSSFGFQPRNFLCPSIQDSICLSQDIRNAQIFESKEEAVREVFERKAWMGSFARMYEFNIHPTEEFS